LLFGERALGTLPDDLHKERMVEHHEMLSEPDAIGTPVTDTPVTSDVETKGVTPISGGIERTAAVHDVSKVESKAKVEGDAV
jgi:hypothetical protein